MDVIDEQSLMYFALTFAGFVVSHLIVLAVGFLMGRKTVDMPVITQTVKNGEEYVDPINEAFDLG